MFQQIRRAAFAIALSVGAASAVTVFSGTVLATPAEAGTLSSSIGSRLFGGLGAGVAAAARQNQMRNALGSALTFPKPQPSGGLGAGIAAAVQRQQQLDAVGRVLDGLKGR